MLEVIFAVVNYFPTRKPCIMLLVLSFALPVVSDQLNGVCDLARMVQEESLFGSGEREPVPLFVEDPQELPVGLLSMRMLEQDVLERQ